MVGKDCEYCDEDVETSAATDSVTIDVYELSISRDPYLGLDRTDEGRKSRTVKDASVAVSPVFSGTTNVLWTACGICEFVGPTDQTSVQYRNKDFETASESVGKERLVASVTLAGMDSSVVCSTNFTVVKVDVNKDGECISCMTSDIIVGEKLSLSACLTPSQIAFATFTWSIPEIAIRDWIADDRKSKVVELGEHDLGLETLDFCWVGDANVKKIVLSAFLETSLARVWADFNIQRPSCRIDTEVGQVVISDGDLCFGNPDTMPGVMLGAVRVNDVPGVFNWVQICQRSHREHIGANGERVVVATSGLDTEYPYSVGPVLLDSPRTRLEPPYSNIDFTCVRVEDKFRAFLLFKSFSRNSAWVPIASVTWGWSAMAEKDESA